MSILQVAVASHLKHQRMSFRELLEAAYYKRYGKPIPQRTLDQDVMDWEKGISTIPYLYDFMLGVRCS